jgi:hypothetical protein
MLETILVALAPKILDMVVDIFTAEKDPELDTGYKRHDHVIKKAGERITEDPQFEELENRDVMNILNVQIKDAVKKLNEEGLL